MLSLSPPPICTEFELVCLFICSFFHNQLFFYNYISTFQSIVSFVIRSLVNHVFITMVKPSKHHWVNGINRAQNHKYIEQSMETFFLLLWKVFFLSIRSLVARFLSFLSPCLQSWALFWSLLLGLFVYLFFIFSFSIIVLWLHALCAIWPPHLTFDKLNLCVLTFCSQFPLVPHLKNIFCDSMRLMYI